MALAKTYSPSEKEPALQKFWQESGTYTFDLGSNRPIYSIDTPPPTVSGKLHIGHIYSYSHADFMARFFRMRGFNVYYPMGYDDNGLPTDRLVEKRLGITAQQVGRQAFIEHCLQVSAEVEQEYQALWQRLGLSVDWRYTYRTIDENSRRASQLSFLLLYQKGLAYRRSAPAIWCPECRVSIAQADLNDLERESEFVTVPFQVVGGATLQIATTRPELLSACVAVFVHPEDRRYTSLIGQRAIVPIYEQAVPILADPAADPQKGTGAVMCCTFGDQTDVSWWFTHHLPLVEAIDSAGCMTAAAGHLAGLSLAEARRRIKEDLTARQLMLSRQPTRQSVRVHERCDTPVEYIQAAQWFIRVLDHKDELLRTGEQVRWHPEAMQSRYAAWVENLNWDWCISRQRYFGVPFPLWYCNACGAVNLALESELPVDPLGQSPSHPCNCGSTSFTPESDTMDTWATSSLTPQICGGWLSDPEFYQKVFPFSLRPQAHEIIRTWAFYTIVKSKYHFDALPWSDILISGWAIAGEGMGKISKSRGGGPASPTELIARYSADALRYWAASTNPGKDAVISEEKFQMGARLVTKLWNVARFSEQFLQDPQPTPPSFSTADRWIMARLQQIIRRATIAMQAYEFAAAKSEVENFFWKDLADNYLEMAKQRLYNPDHPQHSGACSALRTVLPGLLKCLAPFLPFITEAIYQELFAPFEKVASIHNASWPQPDPIYEDPAFIRYGEMLVEIATAVRRAKSEKNMGLGAEFSRLQLTPASPQMRIALQQSLSDLSSVTRAEKIDIIEAPVPAGSGELKIEIDL